MFEIGSKTATPSITTVLVAGSTARTFIARLSLPPAGPDSAGCASRAKVVPQKTGARALYSNEAMRGYSSAGVEFRAAFIRFRFATCCRRYVAVSGPWTRIVG